MKSLSFEFVDDFNSVLICSTPDVENYESYIRVLRLYNYACGWLWVQGGAGVLPARGMAPQSI